MTLPDTALPPLANHRATAGTALDLDAGREELDGRVADAC